MIFFCIAKDTRRQSKGYAEEFFAYPLRHLGVSFAQQLISLPISQINSAKDRGEANIMTHI